MPSELGQTNNPKDLVSGDPAALEAVELKLLTYAGYLHQAGDGLKRIDTEDGWRGEAAEKFRDAFRGEPTRWLEAGDAFEQGANATSKYRSTLGWAQGQAQVAIDLWNEGQGLTAAAKADHTEAVVQAKQQAAAMTSMGVPTTPVDMPFADPGAAKRAAARDILMRAREQLDMVGHEAATAVEAARDKAPEKPNFFQQVGEFLGEVGRGAVEGTVGLVEFALMVQPTRLYTDPFGYVHDMAALTTAMSYTATHFTEVASASWDEFKNNPGRGIGQLLPGLALGGGAGAAIKGAQKVSTISKVASSSKTSSRGSSSQWFEWSNNQGGRGHAAESGLSAGQRADGGNFWTNSDGSSGRSVTRDNGDGTFTNHIVEYGPSGRGTAYDHTFTADGRDVSSEVHKGIKR
jgi:hypothetical protein